MPHTKEHTPIPDHVDLPEDAVVAGGNDDDSATIFKDMNTARRVAREMTDETRVVKKKHDGEQRAVIQRKIADESQSSGRMEVFTTDG